MSKTELSFSILIGGGIGLTGAVVFLVIFLPNYINWLAN